MGGFCCCPCGEDFEEYTHPSNILYRHCMCLRYFLHQLFNGYGPSFQRLEGRIQVATSLTSTPEVTTLPEFSLPDTYHLVPRPLPFESDGLISRRDKTTRDIQDYQHIRKNSASSDFEELGSGKKLKNADFDEESRDYMLRNLEDEDCPVCLEEYNPENPKIETKCSHHFHLSCIYEWMEKSESCPICGKVWYNYIFIITFLFLFGTAH
ncbi:E3 ubiquitin-protein ligase [Platanthera zijinensis]|uniref:RING-type E3 ubiquitin transferase n=1 Tax=Platanthera zijinensis TaxID=2320716 RepID=A0AAP0AYY2_9ASPA